MTSDELISEVFRAQERLRAYHEVHEVAECAEDMRRLAIINRVLVLRFGLPKVKEIRERLA